MTESGVSPEPGSSERIADALDLLAGQLQQAAENLRVLAGEVRDLDESLKNWVEVAMRAGERAVRQIDWKKTCHPPPPSPEEKRARESELFGRLKEASSPDNSLAISGVSSESRPPAQAANSLDYPAPTTEIQLVWYLLRQVAETIDEKAKAAYNVVTLLR